MEALGEACVDYIVWTTRVANANSAHPPERLALPGTVVRLDTETALYEILCPG